MSRTAILELENEVTMRHPKTDYGFDNKDIAKTVIIQKDRHGFLKKSTDDSLYCRVIESRLDLYNGNICMTIFSSEGLDDWDSSVYFFARCEEDNASPSEFYGGVYNDIKSLFERSYIEINADPNNYCAMCSIQFSLDTLLTLCADTYDENNEYDAIAFYFRKGVADPETAIVTNRYYVFRLDYKFIDRYLQQDEPDNKHYYFPVEVIDSLSFETEEE